MPSPSPIQQLYESRVYPAMSHPLSDPAVSAVAARLAGLAVRHPAEARILEIGCGSGLNLIPLAMRWPHSHWVGIDLSGPSIQTARHLAVAAGVTNIGFHAVDLRDFDPAGEGYDFIIAHGFLSWVPVDVQAALFAFCQRNLAPAGMATISFNLESGWLARFPVIEKVRAIQQAGAGDEMSALVILRSVTEPNSPELPIIDDMMAKGPAILAFDDFGPINEPWSLERFLQTAADTGLRWLGESHPGNNQPANLEPQTVRNLQRDFPDPLAFQLAADAASQRTFRSGVLCRADARVEERIRLEQVLDFSVRENPVPHSGGAVAPACRPASRPLGSCDERFFQTLASFAPACVALEDLMVAMGRCERREVARLVYAGIHGGRLEARIEPVRYQVEPPARPALNGFRRESVRRGLPLVDIWHQPCSFPGRHDEVLAAMDGTRDLAELGAFSQCRCPELAFEPWLRHLAGRGMFA